MCVINPGEKMNRKKEKKYIVVTRMVKERKNVEKIDKRPRKIIDDNRE